MKQQFAGADIVPYPKMRRWTAAAYHSVVSKPMIHGLFEADVTTARTLLREHKARTGETLSFTAFLTACLARAVEEHKEVQAMRYGRKRLVIFDDVDVWIPIEREADGQKMPLPHIVRAANRKSFHAISDEIRTAQASDIASVVRGPRFVTPALFRPYIWLFWRIGRMRPLFQKRATGTVSLTSVGMFSKSAGWGIPPPSPLPLMLTVGGIGKRQEYNGEQVVTREYLSLTISVDHTIVDGAPAARFARRLTDLIESAYGLAEGMGTSEAPAAVARAPKVVRATHAR